MNKSLLNLNAFIFFTLVIFNSCSKEEDKTPVATVFGDATVTSHSAILSATIDDKGSAITSGGFYWSRKPNPTANDSVVTGEVFNNLLSATLEDLPQGETFYYAAFAVNAEGTGVSAPKAFTLIHNVPQLEILVNDVEIDNQVTVEKQVANSFTVKCSMLVEEDFVLLSNLKISVNIYGTINNIVDQIVSGTNTEYTTELTFSNPGTIEMIFELTDEYDNVTTKTVTVTVI